MLRGRVIRRVLALALWKYSATQPACPRSDSTNRTCTCLSDDAAYRWFLELGSGKWSNKKWMRPL